MVLLLRDDVIQLHRTESTDLDFVIDAERAQENAEFVGQWPLGQHERALSDPDVLHLSIRDTVGQPIGYAIIRGLCSPDDSVELMRIVITAKGQGYGTHAISLIKKWCFETRKAHRLWLDVREKNTRAQLVYEAQGFVREGLLRECVKVGGKYQSLIVMSILWQDYAPDG